MQLMRAVELVILQRVNDVKADEPEHDRRRQQQRQDRAFAQWPECEAVLDREPRADGRQREGYTEKHVREIGEALGERIKADEKQRHGREVKTDFVQQETEENEAQTAQRAQRPRAGERDLPGWQMAVHRARIFPVELAVNDPIECHRAGAGAKHRGQDQAERSPAGPTTLVARGDDHGRQRERQREDGVGETHEGQPFVNEGKHRTSNIERRTSKFQPPGQEGTRWCLASCAFTAFCWAVRMLDMKMRINSSDSPKTRTSFGSSCAHCLRSISRAHRRVSRSSLRQTFSLWMKSSRDSA